MQQLSLSTDDVKNLMESPSEAVRAETATKICTAYTSETLTDSQRKIAEDVFNLLVKDQSKRVRESIANNLKDTDQLPNDLAIRLAGDLEDSVAVPMLQCSHVLSDQDLIDIIRVTDSERRAVIAERKTVSEDVSAELVEHGDSDVVVRLIRNDGADIPTQSFESAQERFSGEDRFDTALVARDRVPSIIRSKIVAALTDQYLGVLAGDIDASPSVIADIVIQSHDKLVMQLSESSTEASVLEFVDNLLRSGRLTQSILIRSLCQGDLLFFESALARLAGVPITNVNKLLNDGGRKGFTALCEKIGFNSAYQTFFGLAFGVCKGLLESGEDYDQTEYRKKIIERFLTEDPEIVDRLDRNDLEYLMGKV